jgi:hypothetical protein
MLSGTVENSPAKTGKRFYRVPDIARLWGVSEDLVRRLFRHEPGVIVIPNSRAGVRSYNTLLIPAEVLERVQRRLSGRE